MFTVLLVDDFDDTLQTLSLLYRLNPKVTDVQIAHNSAEMWAVLEAEQHRVNLISLDISLGPEDGLQLCKEVHTRYPKIFVVMCSLDASDENKATALSAGASRFFAKPVGRSDIQFAIDSCTYSRHTSEPSDNEQGGWIGDLLDTL